MKKEILIIIIKTKNNNNNITSNAVRAAAGVLLKYYYYYTCLRGAKKFRADDASSSCTMHLHGFSWVCVYNLRGRRVKHYTIIILIIIFQLKKCRYTAESEKGL